MQRFIGTISLLFFAMSMVAQTASDWRPTHQVLLHNGDVLLGILIRYDEGQLLKIELENEIMTIDAGYVQRIFRVENGKLPVAPKRETADTDVPSVEPKKDAKPLKYEGWYHQTMFGLLSGSVSNNVRVNGASLSTVYGYQWRNWLGLGLGVSVDNYRPGNLENIIPLYLELRSYPFRQPRSNFTFSVAGGYGFLARNAELGLTDGEGGLMFQPAVGFRFGTRSGTEIITEVGYRWQQANFIFQQRNGTIEVRDVTYQRFVLRLGVIMWRKKQT